MSTTEQKPVPIGNSYWVVPGRLLAGEYPGEVDEQATRRRLERFLAMELRTFIDLTGVGEHGRHSYVPILRSMAGEQQVLYHNLPISDMGLATTEGMTQILDLIDAALERGENVYLHCMAGVGRTGTVIGCYLARHGHPGDAALEELTRLRRNSANSLWPSPETPAQREMVVSWPVGK